MDIFDKFGRLDTSAITPEQVEALTEEQRDAFFACIESSQRTQDAEERERASILNVRDKMRTQAETLAAHIQANPPQTRIEAMREVLARQNGTPLKTPVKTSHAKIAHKGPRLAYEAAELALTEARAEMYAAQADVRRLRPISADALTKFIATFRQKTTMEVHREMVAGQQAEKLRRVNAGLPAIPEKPAPVFRWPIEAALANNGKNKRPYGR